jgi:hypothetical protein
MQDWAPGEGSTSILENDNSWHNAQMTFETIFSQIPESLAVCH